MATKRRHHDDSDIEIESDSDSYDTDTERADRDSNNNNSVTKTKVRKIPGARLVGTVSDSVIAHLEEKYPGVFVKVKAGMDDGRAPTPTSAKVKCTVCNCKVNVGSGSKDAVSHATTSKHVKNLKGKEGQRDLFSSGLRKVTGEEKDPVLDGEILISQWIAGSNLPFTKATELMQ